MVLNSGWWWRGSRKFLKGSTKRGLAAKPAGWLLFVSASGLLKQCFIHLLHRHTQEMVMSARPKVVQTEEAAAHAGVTSTWRKLVYTYISVFIPWNKIGQLCFKVRGGRFSYLHFPKPPNTASWIINTWSSEQGETTKTEVWGNTQFIHAPENGA